MTFKLFGIISLSLKEFALAFLLLMIAVSAGRYASAQSIPMLPPPFPENSPEEERIAENDRTPPQIEILTTELHEGKNVFKVRITDESSLRTREVKYVHNGQLRVDGLFRDQNNVYKALIDIQPPSRVVLVTAGDANGNIVSEFGEYEITKSQDIFTQVMDRLSQTLDYFQNLFGW
ncbi:MAG TPA: hypothetical protein VHJ59_05705 [Nitrososphaera sp.]|jgi:hypothetical protein|nr:hypothetical protein [Nitrososphaera sp.]